jgi:hypothetical protein
VEGTSHGGQSHREVHATAWRELAERARRLAGGLWDDPARNALLQYSKELEEKAAKLDAPPDPREEQDKP